METALCSSNPKDWKQIIKTITPSSESLCTVWSVVNRVKQDLSELLSAEYAVVSGSLAKNTNIADKFDVDMVFFVKDISLQNWGDKLKELMQIISSNVNTWRGYLKSIHPSAPSSEKFNSPVSTSHAVKFSLYYLKFDVLLAPFGGYNSITDSTFFLLSSTDDEKERDYFSAATCELQLIFLSRQSGFIRNVIRIAKFWKHSLKLDNSQKPKSYLIELLVIYAYQLMTPENRTSEQLLFAAFLQLVTQYKKIAADFTHFFYERYMIGLKENKKLPWSQHMKPIVVDPSNPFNNVAAKYSGWEALVQKATETLEKMNIPVRLISFEVQNMTSQTPSKLELSNGISLTLHQSQTSSKSESTTEDALLKLERLFNTLQLGLSQINSKVDHCEQSLTDLSLKMSLRIDKCEQSLNSTAALLNQKLVPYEEQVLSLQRKLLTKLVRKLDDYSNVTSHNSKLGYVFKQELFVLDNYGSLRKAPKWNEVRNVLAFQVKESSSFAFNGTQIFHVFKQVPSNKYSQDPQRIRIEIGDLNGNYAARDASTIHDIDAGSIARLSTTSCCAGVCYIAGWQSIIKAELKVASNGFQFTILTNGESPKPNLFKPYFHNYFLGGEEFLIVFGGSSNNTWNDELWLYTKSKYTWCKPATTGPKPLIRAYGISVVHRNLLLVYQETCLYSLNLSSWKWTKFVMGYVDCAEYRKDGVALVVNDKLLLTGAFGVKNENLTETVEITLTDWDFEK